MKAAFDREWKSVNKQWEEKINPHRVAKGMYPFSGGQRDSKVTNLKSNENEHTKVTRLKSDWVFTKLEQLESKFKERLETMEQRLEIIEQRLQVLSDEIARISPVPPPPASTPPPPGSTPPPPASPPASPPPPPASTAAPRCQLKNGSFCFAAPSGLAEDGAQKNDEMSAAPSGPAEDGGQKKDEMSHPGAEVDVPDLAVPVTELADWQAVDLKADRRS